MAALWLFSLLCALTCVGATAPAGPWDAFNYAPNSRTVRPTAIKEVSGRIENPQHLTSKGRATLVGNGAWVALDFGIEVSTRIISRIFHGLTCLGRRPHLVELRHSFERVLDCSVVHRVPRLHKPYHV